MNGAYLVGRISLTSSTVLYLPQSVQHFALLICHSLPGDAYFSGAFCYITLWAACRCDWGVGDPWLWADKVCCLGSICCMSTIILSVDCL